MDKLVMGYWDCSYCGEKKIPGTVRDCPACGKARGEDTEFYMDKGSNKYLSDEEAKTKGKGADWYCSYCDSLNSVLDDVCKSCGATKAESEKNYFEMRQKKQEEEAKKAAHKQEVQKRMTEPPKKKSPFGLILIPLVLILAFVFLLMPKKADLKITDVYWSNSINVERYQQVEESGWSLPSGAELQYTRREIQSYESVFDHYEERNYSETVPSGSHTEYSYSNNGDGTFTEHAYQVTDYETVWKTEQVPVYRQEPVYANKYYYLVWRWLQERTVDNEGHDKKPVWGDLKLASDEREGSRSVYYQVTGVKKDKERNYEVSEEIFQKLKVGDQIQCKVRGNAIIELE